MSRTLPKTLEPFLHEESAFKGGNTIDRQELERRRQKRLELQQRRELRRRRLLHIAVRTGIALVLVLAVFWIGRRIFSGIRQAQTQKLAESTAQSAASLGEASHSAIAAMAMLPASTQTPAPESVQLADPLLVLVNQETPLPDDWTVDLVPVTEGSEELIDARAYDDLFAMTEAARKEGVWFWVTSAYRSRELQEDILERKIQENISAGMSREDAEEDALRTIQRPGYSEHHTGLVVDFNDASSNFEETDCYYWLNEHAAEYGFVQRYKQRKSSITGIDNEGWHYRYVGKLYAEEMERLDMCLEEYVDFLKNSQ